MDIQEEVSQVSPEELQETAELPETEELSEASRTEAPKKKEKPEYFWDKISLKTLQKGIVFFCIVLCLAPIFASIGVRPWIYCMRGEMGVRMVNYEIIGELWYSAIYILSMAATAWMLLVLTRIHKHNPLSCLRSESWQKSHWLPIFMLLLLVWSLLSGIFAIDHTLAFWGDWYGHEGILMYIFYGAFFVMAAYISERQMKTIAEVLMAVCAVTGLLTITGGTLVPGLFYLEDERTVMFHNNNHYGYFLAICTPVMFGLALQDKKMRWPFQVLRLLEIWLIFNAVAVNSVRGSFLGILFALICWNVFVFTGKKDLRVRMLVLDGLFVAVLVFLNTGSQLAERMWVLIQQLAGFAGAEDKTAAFDTMGSSRGVLWRRGMQLACQRPVFGYGPDCLVKAYAQFEDCTLGSPHNDLVLIAASLGFPALMFYLAGLGGHLVFSLRYFKKLTVVEAAVFAGVGSYLVSSMAGVSMYYTTPYFYILLGYSYRICKRYMDAEAAEKMPAQAPEQELPPEPETEESLPLS